MILLVNENGYIGGKITIEELTEELKEMYVYFDLNESPEELELGKSILVKDVEGFINKQVSDITDTSLDYYNLDSNNNLIKIEIEGVLIAKENKLQELKGYDKSNDINNFSFAGQDMWITRNDRQTILTRLNSNKTIGLEKDTINGVELPIDTWIGIISQIENYASKCYDKTQEHKSNIEKLTIREEVENYNFKVGYPDKLEFEL